ncbi:DUF3592 domain-containing protein [Hydrogenophaga palleronii]
MPSALTALGAAWLLASSLNTLDNMQTAQGRVVGHQDAVVGPSTRRAFGQQSIVEFVASDGRSLRFTDDVVRQLQAVHDVGEKVTVRYPANDPSKAEISSSSMVKVFIGAVLLLFSGIGLVLGWLLLRLSPKAPTGTSTA